MAALLLLVGVFACSTSVIFIKRSGLDPALLSGLRCLLAAALLTPFFFRARSRNRNHWHLRELRRSVAPALVLAVHFISWAIGARGTLAANASLIVNMVPLAMPYFLAVLVGERMKRAELLGTALGLAGVILLSGGDVRTGREFLAGDVTCFVSMLLYALYLTLGRRNRDVPSLWLYLVPLYAMSGIICFGVGLARAGWPAVTAAESINVLGLAAVPTLIGHSFLNLSLRNLRGSTVSVCNLGQFLFAVLMGWAFFGEVPKAAFWPAAALIVAGAVTALRSPAEERAVTAPSR